MKKSEIITAIIAVYGAVLSTVAAIRIGDILDEPVAEGGLLYVITTDGKASKSAGLEHLLCNWFLNLRCYAYAPISVVEIHR